MNNAFLTNGYAVVWNAEPYHRVIKRLDRPQAAYALRSFVLTVIIPKLGAPLSQEKWVELVGLIAPKLTQRGTEVCSWMRATPTESRFGPTTATATAGNVTVTATAKVTSVAWNMADGTTVTCYGPGTPYTKDQGKRMSPDCGHQYTLLSGSGEVLRCG